MRTLCIAGHRALETSLLAAVLLLAACSPDYRALRADHAARVVHDDLARSRDLLAERGALRLADCLAIALADNLDIALADLGQRLATIDRRSAFGNFLPVIDLQAGWQTSRFPREAQAGGSWMQVADRSSFQASLGVQQPILVPQAFVLYQMQQQGEEIAALVAARTRQQIIHLVTARFYAALAAARQVELARQELERIDVLAAEIAAFQREGLVSDLAQAQAQAQRAAAGYVLAEAERSQRLAESQLLEAMGLHPLADLALADAAPLSRPEGDLAELALQALTTRLELRIADQEWGLARQQARLALLSWLPNILGFGALDYSSDSYVRRSLNASLGLGAVVNLLDGLRTHHAVTRARSEQERVLLRRDQQALAIVLEVQEALQQVESAERLLEVSAAALAAAERAVQESEAHWREGLLRASERLASQSALSRARSQSLLAGYQREVALATLRDVLGLAELDADDPPSPGMPTP